MRAARTPRGGGRPARALRGPPRRALRPYGAADLSLLQIAAFAVGLLPTARLHAIAAELSEAEATAP
ncbi:hypothetical protein ACN9M0_34995 [Streptomyces sp. R-07]|uniref:hypothetical protein n=1 Tax=unclassified Streptomyces TaxID=2593676 RepID=UPI0034183595